MKPQTHKLGPLQVIAELNAAMVVPAQRRVVEDVTHLSESSFRRGLQANVTAFWNGTFDLIDFMDAMFALVEVEYANAWHAGMRAAGMDPQDMTMDEQTALQSHIFGADGHVYDFGVYVEQHRKETGDRLKTLQPRIDLWLTGYNTVYNDALTFAASDPNLMWVLGPTEKHCDSCLRLNGKIKRASVWDASMLQPAAPPNPYLTCGGWRCECTFEVTSANQTRGRLPRLAIRPSDWQLLAGGG